MTKVIFRKFKDGEIIAIFPYEISNYDPKLCLSYMSIGQHGSCDPHICRDGTTRPASPEEWTSLFDELVSMGYDDLRVIRKVPRNAINLRISKLQQHCAAS